MIHSESFILDILTGGDKYVWIRLGGCGFGYGGGFYGGSTFVLIVVLFVLLIIVGTSFIV
ncbi:YjcZ family sporulation protein [Bacillus salipaludis]|uniref:YjcZ family sporulation protein n=1 Tax=Bacillus salipaludis TaxID=2547811 RepID=A0A4R5VJ07_9BACI|nr:YjcZ family sporulation protein [Bacillus salipaludis]